MMRDGQADEVRSGLDEKLAALMNKLDQKENKQNEIEAKEKGSSVSTYEDYCKLEGLNEWPYRLTSEGPLGLEGDVFGLGSKDDIVNLIKESAPLDLEALDNIERKLGALERVLNVYADKLVTDSIPEAPSELEKWLTSTSKSIDSDEPDLATSRDSKALKKKTFSESVAEMRKRSIEYCSFPGFRKGELTELPSQLEGPQILHRVTKVQDFNPGFKKFWQKIFLSEASVAIMQDFFWWFFLDNYETDRKKEQTQLYDRIADSFVALFNSINPEIKDKFFQVYDNCLAQSIFIAYHEAFTESQKVFDDKFRANLLSITSQWISGVRPPPDLHQQWNLKRLLKKTMRPGEESKSTVHKMASAAALSQDGVQIDLGIDSFEKMVNRLGDTGPASRQNTAEKAASRPTAVQPTQPRNTSRQGQMATPGKYAKESHQVGPGPKFERVLFNTLGRSPLVAHYLHRRQLQDINRPELKVKRTEIVEIPPDAPTYRDLINNKLTKSVTLSKEYQRICDQTNQELQRIERKKLETNREIDRLQKEIMFNRNPIDLKIMSEKILEMRERDVSTGLHSGDLKTQLDDNSDNDSDY